MASNLRTFCQVLFICEGNKMKKVLFLLVSLFAGTANAAIISSAEWEVTDISGSWDAATSGWWLYESTPTASEADGYMSDGYTAYPQSYSSPQNGYSTYNNSATSVLEISFNDLYSFSNIDLWVTRNNSSQTTVNVLGQSEGSGWNSLLSTTTGALGLPVQQTFNLQIASLALASASTFDQIRLEFGTQGQVILHELVFDGENTVSTVPEPASLALLMLGLVGIGFTRRKI
jgi:hypothetical protein